MIITRTPFRISLFGGGTDYPIYYKENGGAVLSTTINKHCYIQCRYLPPFFDHDYRIRYTYKEETCNINEIKHPSARECIKFVNLDKGIEMVHTSDIPAQSGMGSSSAFTVGFLNALNALKGNIITKRQLANDAIHLEQDIIKENVGSQDQVVAAFGGFNKIDFGTNPEFEVHPVVIGKDKLTNLQNHLMLFFTGFSRNASDIAAEQIKITNEKKDDLKIIHKMVNEAIEILNCNNSDINEIGELLNTHWNIKRELTTKITNLEIDKIYESAIKAGAIGGKLLGAGGGGCMLFFVEPENQNKVKQSLNNLVHIPFKFENLGSQIIYYEPNDSF